MSEGFLEPVVATAVFDVAAFLTNAQKAVGATGELTGSLDKAGIAAAKTEVALSQAALKAAASQDKAAAAATRYAKAQSDAVAAGIKASSGEITLAEAADKAAAAQDAGAKAAQAQAKAALDAQRAIILQSEANARLAETAGVATKAQADAAAASVGLAAKSREAGVALAGSAGVVGRAATTAKNNWILAAAVIGFESVKLAGTFEQQTNVLVTAAGESSKNLGLIRSGILGIAESTGTAWKDVTAGVYVAEKAGFRGADALQVVRASAQGAREEQANLATVLNATTSVMASYGLKASDAVRVTNEIKTAAGESKTTMELFAGSLSTVLPVASAAHISFADVAGALATLTQHGTSADEGTQELAATIRNLQAPLGTARREMAQFGIDSVNVAQNLGSDKRGLTGTIDYLTQIILGKLGPSGLVLLNTFNQSKQAAAAAQTEMNALPPAAKALAQGFEDGTVSVAAYRKESRALPGEQAVLAQQFFNTYSNAKGFQDVIKQGGPAAQTYVQALKAMLGGAIGLNTALQLTGPNLDATKERTKKVADAAKGAGKDVSGWASTQKLFNVQLDGFIQQLAAAGIHLGDDLLPPLKEVLGVLSAHPVILQAVAAGLGLMIARWAALKTLGLIEWVGGLTTKMLGLEAASAAAAGEAGVAGLSTALVGLGTLGVVGVLAGIAVGIDKIATSSDKTKNRIANDLGLNFGAADFEGMIAKVQREAAAARAKANVPHKSILSQAQGPDPLDLTTALAAAHDNLANAQLGNASAADTLATAQAALSTALKTTGDTLGKQFDLFDGYKDKVQITGQDLIANVQSTMTAIVNEGTNAQKLAAEGLSGSVIQGLVAKGPEYVAAAAALSLQDVQKYGVLQIQAVQAYERTKHQVTVAEVPKTAADVQNALNAEKPNLLRAYSAVYQGTFLQVAKQILGVASFTGKGMPDNVAQGILEHKQNVINALEKGMSEPQRQALTALETYATSGGAKTAQNLADAITNHTPLVVSKAQALKDGINAQITAILKTWGITVTVDDQATAKLQAIAADVKTLGLAGVASSTFTPSLAQQFQGGHIVPTGATGGRVFGPGSGTSDSIPAWLSNGEFIVNAKATSENLPLLQAINSFAAGGLASLATRITIDADPVVDKLAAFSSAAGNPGGAGVTRWAPDVLQVLGMLGLPLTLLPRVLAQINTESGGNPNAINLTDSNAAKGVPSMGVLQTILPTFNEWAGPYAGLGPYNGFADIYAGVNYAAHRYAGDPNIGLGYGHGYAKGGLVGSYLEALLDQSQGKPTGAKKPKFAPPTGTAGFLDFLHHHPSAVGYFTGVQKTQGYLAAHPQVEAFLGVLNTVGGAALTENTRLAYNQANLSRATAANVPGLEAEAHDAAQIAGFTALIFNSHKAALLRAEHTGTAAQRRGATAVYNQLAADVAMTGADARGEASLAAQLRRRFAGQEAAPLVPGRPTRDLSYLALAGGQTVPGTTHAYVTTIVQLDNREIARGTSKVQLKTERRGLNNGATRIRNP